VFVNGDSGLGNGLLNGDTQTQNGSSDDGGSYTYAGPPRTAQTDTGKTSKVDLSKLYEQCKSVHVLTVN